MELLFTITRRSPLIIIGEIYLSVTCRLERLAPSRLTSFANELSLP